MSRAKKPFNRKHDLLQRRARAAVPGQRRTRNRELVHYVARLMAPRAVRARARARGLAW